MPTLAALFLRYGPPRLRRAFVRNLGLPQGRLGRFVGRQLIGANEGNYRLVLSALAIRDGEEVLEVGPGPGAAVPAILAVGRDVSYMGVDASATMVEMARRRNADAVRAGRARIVEGTTEALPREDASVDVALALNVVYFWPDPDRAVGELGRVLRPGGRLGIGYRPQADADPELSLRFEEAGHRLVEVADVERLLATAGLGSIQTQRNPEGGAVTIGHARS